MSERKMREDGLGRDPDGSGCRPSDETPEGSHASGASIPRAELAAIIRRHIRCDASGLAPAVASVFLCGFDEAAGAISERLASAIGKAEAPINPVLLAALKAMDEALTNEWGSPKKMHSPGDPCPEAWIQIRSAISQADGR